MTKLFSRCTLISFVLIFGFVANLFAQRAQLDWAKQMEGGFDRGISLTTDDSGNVYTTGMFFNTTDFNPNSGNKALTSNGRSDIFIQKLTSKGELSWALGIGGNERDYGKGITTDNAGNVYVTGYFKGEVDFDPSNETKTLTTQGERDIFVLKLSQSGDFKWVRKMGGNMDDEGLSIASHGASGLYITGYFKGQANFGTGQNSKQLVSNGYEETFIQKLNHQGELQWAYAIGGENEDRGRSVTTDASGNVYFTGFFSDTVDFDPGTGQKIENGNILNDIFIEKLDPAGNLLWVHSFGGFNIDEGQAVQSDKKGHIYLVGNFRETVDFGTDSQSVQLTSDRSEDIFVQKFDTSGRMIWVRANKGYGFDRGFDLAIDTAGSSYITGRFNHTVDFDPGKDTLNLTAQNQWDVFIQKLDADGSLVWAESLKGEEGNKGSSITLGNDEGIYVTGDFKGTVDFDPGPEKHELSTGRGPQIFVLKLSQTNQPVGRKIKQNSEPSVKVYPNPTTGKVIVHTSKPLQNGQVTVSTMSGKVVQIKSFESAKTIRIALDKEPGYYVLELQAQDSGYRTTVPVLKK